MQSSLCCCSAALNFLSSSTRDFGIFYHQITGFCVKPNYLGSATQISSPTYIQYIKHNCWSKQMSEKLKSNNCWLHFLFANEKVQILKGWLYKIGVSKKVKLNFSLRPSTGIAKTSCWMLTYKLKPSFKKSKDSGARMNWDFKSLGRSQGKMWVSHARNSLRQELFYEIPLLEWNLMKIYTARLESYREKKLKP